MFEDSRDASVYNLRSVCANIGCDENISFKTFLIGYQILVYWWKCFCLLPFVVILSTVHSLAAKPLFNEF